MGVADLEDRLLMAVEPRDLRTRVLIWTLTADAFPPPQELLAALDGLVLAAPGAGSVARGVLDALGSSLRAVRESRAPFFPVVLCSRCGCGPSHDAGLYGEASARQYEEAGLDLGRGTPASLDDGGGGLERVSPLQARLALSVALSIEARKARGGPL